MMLFFRFILIEPVGIETLNNHMYYLLMYILIEPVGIETYLQKVKLLIHTILIEPVGIETDDGELRRLFAVDFNRTSWN